MTRHNLLRLLLLLGLAAHAPFLRAQLLQPQTVMISHTDVQGGEITGSCGTIPDADTAADYSPDALCSLNLFGIELLKWSCSGSTAEACIGPPDNVLPGDSYETDGAHFLTTQVFDFAFNIWVDVWGYSTPGFGHCPGNECFYTSTGLQVDVQNPTIALATTFDPYTTSSVSPLTQTAFAGQSYLFTATNSTGGPSIWSVSGGGLNGPGSVSVNPNGLSATYTAPSTISTAAQAFVEACNSDTAHGQDCPFVTVNLTPLTVTIDQGSFTELLPGNTKQFTASVAPSLGPQTVTWSLLSNPNGAGAITSGGLFTAQPVIQDEDVIVQACSTVDSNRCATTTVSVPFAVVNVNGPAQTILASIGTQEQFIASVAGPTQLQNIAVQWTATASLGPAPTIDVNGLFTVPATPINDVTTVTIKACLVLQPANCGTFFLTMVPPVAFTMTNSSWASGESTPITITGTGLGTAPTVTPNDPRITFQQTSISFIPGVSTTIQGNISVPLMSIGENTGLTVTSSINQAPISQQQASRPATVVPVTISVSVVPTSASLLVTQAQQFTPTVSCLTKNKLVCSVPQAVTCSINPVVGTMNSSSCLYSAPSTLAALQTINGKACSVFSPASCSANIPITLTPISVSVTPINGGQLIAGQTEQFTAVLTNSPGNNQGVTWSISPAVGSIDPVTGIYTAPNPVPSALTVTVTACSIVDTSRCGSSPVNLVPVSVAVGPATASLNPSGQQQFSATVTGATSQNVTWSISPSTLGTITATGLYTAPPPPNDFQQTVTVSACSTVTPVPPNPCGTAQVTLLPSPDFSVAVAPSPIAVTPSGSATYNVTVTPLNGFTGTVNLSGSSSPAGPVPSFSPSSVTITSGALTSTLTVATNASTAIQNYTITATGNGTGFTHTASVVLSVVDFALSATPGSQTASGGGSATYTVTSTALNGFNFNVPLAASGQPQGVVPIFTPPSITGPGTSTLSLPISNTTAPGNYPITVSGTSTAGGGSDTRTASPVTLTVAPVITALSPAAGPVSTLVTISGTNFGPTPAGNTVTFNSVSAAISSWSDTSIVAQVPIGVQAGNVSVVVTANGVSSNSAAFTVTVSIVGLSQSSGPVGSSVTISGTGFGAAQGSSTVTFNGSPATPTSWSPTSIVAPVPSGLVPGGAPIVVTVGGISSNSAGFTVTPGISSLSPGYGAVGSLVTITGTSFGTTQGTGTVTFNGVNATVSSWSNASVVAAVPAGATTGNVVVTAVDAVTGAGVPSNAAQFIVTAPTTFDLTSASSTTPGLMQLSTTVGSSASLLSPNLSNQPAGDYLIQAFDTQAGVPNSANTWPAGLNGTFIVWMKQVAGTPGTLFPEVRLFLNSLTGTPICSSIGATALSTTNTQYSLSCAPASNITLSPTDRYYLWVGVSSTAASSTALQGQLGVGLQVRGRPVSSVTVPIQ